MEELDVAVIGAGVSGLYAAWRLQSEWKTPEGNAPRIAVFERSQRIGGRLHTIQPARMSTLHAEIGGMRLPSFHRFTLGLVDHLGLETKEFREGNANNLFYLRGKHIKGEDFEHADRVPYNLAPDEQGIQPPVLFKHLLQKLVPSEPDLYKMRTQGELHHDGLFHKLLENASHEALQLIQDAGGYYSALGNANLADMLFTLLSHRKESEVHFVTLKAGMQELPRAIASQFERAGGKIHKDARLHELPHPTDATYLSVRSEGGDLRPVKARHVILAMPRRALSLLLGRCFLFDYPQFVQDLESVTGQAASKLFLCFNDTWWSKLGLEAGRSDTDLPMRQCYYFGTEPSNNHGLLMAGYNDGRAVDFWAGFVGEKLADSLLESRLATPSRLLDEITPNSAMVREICRQLAELHGVPVPEPYAAYFVDWAGDPYGGGWHSWKIHARSWEVMPRMRQPVSHVNVYICGEAYSLDQGWVEGALNTAEHMLQEKFGLPAPPYLPAGQFLGD